MGKMHSFVNLRIETAQSSLTVLKAMLAEQMHEDDRVKLDGLIDRASSALYEASSHLSVIRTDVIEAIDKL